MANKKKIQQPVMETLEITPMPVIEPVSIMQTDAPATKTVEVAVPAGHVLLVAIDTNGNDIIGSDFFYAEKSYKRFYGDETKFRVKKTEVANYTTYQHENIHRASQQIIFSTTGRCGSCGR